MHKLTLINKITPVLIKEKDDENTQLLKKFL